LVESSVHAWLFNFMILTLCKFYASMANMR